MSDFSHSFSQNTAVCWLNFKNRLGGHPCCKEEMTRAPPGARFHPVFTHYLARFPFQVLPWV